MLASRYIPDNGVSRMKRAHALLVAHSRLFVILGDSYWSPEVGRFHIRRVSKLNGAESLFVGDKISKLWVCG